VEFLIRPREGDELLAVDKESAVTVLVPRGWICQRVVGTDDFRYRVDDSDVAFRMGIEGWHVTVYGPMTLQTAEGIVAEVAHQVAEATSTPTDWLRLA
jgi:hypothetical protein